VCGEPSSRKYRKTHANSLVNQRTVVDGLFTVGGEKLQGTLGQARPAALPRHRTSLGATHPDRSERGG